MSGVVTDTSDEALFGNHADHRDSKAVIEDSSPNPLLETAEVLAPDRLFSLIY